MPPPLLSMRMIKTLFHQILFLRQSQRQCAQALGISKGVVGKYANCRQSRRLELGRDRTTR